MEWWQLIQTISTGEVTVLSSNANIYITVLSSLTTQDLEEHCWREERNILRFPASHGAGEWQWYGFVVVVCFFFYFFFHFFPHSKSDSPLYRETVNTLVCCILMFWRLAGISVFTFHDIFNYSGIIELCTQWAEEYLNSMIYNAPLPACPEISATYEAVTHRHHTALLLSPWQKVLRISSKVSENQHSLQIHPSC